MKGLFLLFVFLSHWYSINTHAESVSDVFTENSNARLVVSMSVEGENPNTQKTVIRHDYESINQMPDYLVGFIPGDYVYRPHSGFTLLISLPNDDILASLWNQTVGESTDDRGYTHGFGVDLTLHTQRRVNITLHTSTDLYTAGIDRTVSHGLATSSQYFTNENIISLMADNRYEGRTFYWGAEAGWIRLNSETTGRFQATGHQQAWHNLLTNIDRELVFVPQNRSDGLGIRDGVLLGATAGIQHSWHNRFVYLRPYLESSFRMNIFNDEAGSNDLYHRSSYLQLRVGTEFVYQRSPRTVPLRLEGFSEARLHQGGVSVTPGFSLLVGRTLQFGFEYRQNFLNVQNYQEYNLPRRPWNSDNLEFEQKNHYEPTGTIFVRGRLNRDERLIRMRQQRRQSRHW